MRSEQPRHCPDATLYTARQGLSHRLILQDAELPLPLVLERGTVQGSMQGLELAPKTRAAWTAEEAKSKQMKALMKFSSRT